MLALLALVSLLAGTAWAQAAKRTPASSDLRRADGLAVTGKWTQACTIYQRALATADLSSAGYQRSRNLANCFLKAQPADLNSAAQWLEKAVQLQPKSADARLLLAETLVRAGQSERALEHYEALFQAQPSNPKYVVGLANVHQSAGNLAEAAKVLNWYLAARPADLDMRMELGSVLVAAKDYTAAAAQYEQVLAAKPANNTALLALAKVTSWQGNFTGALELYDRILARSPKHYDAQVGKAFALLWSGRKDEARVMLEALHQRNPSDKDVAGALKSLDERAEAAALAAARPPKPAATEPKPVAPAKPEDPLRAQMKEAAAAAGAGEYSRAIEIYREVLAVDPGRTDARLQLARVLSFSRKYEESVAEYGLVLKATPEHTSARWERARILSWMRRFDESIVEYAQVISEAEAALRGGAPKPPISLPTARLEYARVLSWARRYDEALVQLNLLLPEGQQPQPNDVNAMVEKARVLAWQRRYNDALATYDRALALDPADFDARLGKAQVLYWSGRSGQAGDLLRPLLQEQPDHSDATFMMASIERGRGHNGRALDLLDKIQGRSDADSLRTTIREDLRPVLRLRYGYGNERDDDPAFTDSTLRAHRYTAALEFSPHPDIRMTVSNTVTDARGSSPLLNARFGQQGLAIETRASIAFKPARWLRLTLGAGGGSSGGGFACTSAFVLGVCPTALEQQERRYHFLYEVRPVITHRGLRLAGSFTRDLADYTPLSIHDNVVLRREGLSGSYEFWRRRLRMGAGYWHGNYSIDQALSCSTACLPAAALDVNSNNGEIYLTGKLYDSDRLTVELGPRYEIYGFERSDLMVLDNTVGTGGFFTPRVYQKWGGNVAFAVRPHSKVAWNVESFIGQRRFYSLALAQPSEVFSTAGSVRTDLRVNWGRWETAVGYSFSATESPGFLRLTPGVGIGEYNTHYAFAELLIRF